MKIYLIVGNSGEYDSFTEWIAFAYISQEMAELKVESLRELVVKFSKESKKLHTYIEKTSLWEDFPDKNLQRNGEGIYYEIQEIETEDEI